MFPSVKGAKLRMRISVVCFRGLGSSRFRAGFEGELTRVAGVKEGMSLWVDKYRPNTLAKLDYHKDQAAQLKNLVSAMLSCHRHIIGCYW